jgi:hypothetical protein
LIGGKSKTFTSYKLLEQLILLRIYAFPAKSKCVWFKRSAFGVWRLAQNVSGGCVHCGWQILQWECSDVDCLQVQQSGAPGRWERWTAGRKQRRFEDEYEESPLVHKQTCDDCPEHQANDYFMASVTL